MLMQDDHGIARYLSTGPGSERLLDTGICFFVGNHSVVLGCTERRALRGSSRTALLAQLQVPREKMPKLAK